MKGALAVIAGVLMAGSVVAGPMDDFAAGRDALDRGDNDMAIRLLTDALDSGSLNRAQREKALVDRANAELAVDQRTQAIADADAAMAIDRTNAAAAAVKSRALQ